MLNPRLDNLTLLSGELEKKLKQPKSTLDIFGNMIKNITILRRTKFKAQNHPCGKKTAYAHAQKYRFDNECYFVTTLRVF